jgi:hypothetical protein
MHLDQDRKMSRRDWLEFNDRIGEVATIARAATTNAVTALASVTVAIVGASVTVSTATVTMSIWTRSALFAILGAGAAALVMIIALMIEAIKSMTLAVELQSFYDKYSSDATVLRYTVEPYYKRTARISVGAFWKAILPLALLLLGIGAAMVRIVV